MTAGRKLIAFLLSPLYWWAVGRPGSRNITNRLTLPPPTTTALGKFNIYHDNKRVGYITFKSKYRLEAVRVDARSTVLIITEEEKHEGTQ